MRGRAAVWTCPTPSFRWNPAAHGGSVRRWGLWEGARSLGQSPCDGCVEGRAGWLRRPSQQRGDALGTQGGPSCAQTLAQSPVPRTSTDVGKADTELRSPPAAPAWLSDLWADGSPRGADQRLTAHGTHDDSRVIRLTVRGYF